MAHDPVNHPSHYTSHPSGVECIIITEHHDFCVGNAMKYMWRAGLKGDNAAQELEDLKKARWYLTRKIERMERAAAPVVTEPVFDPTRIAVRVASAAEDLALAAPLPAK